MKKLSLEKFWLGSCRLSAGIAFFIALSLLIKKGYPVDIFQDDLQASLVIFSALFVLAGVLANRERHLRRKREHEFINSV